MSTKKLIVVAGPTAVGKTSVALALAKTLQTVVISADSRQLFRELTIGTAKPTPEERRDVPHYFIDTLSITDDYDAARYASDALKLLDELFRQYDTLILCGGSGLYIKGVCEGFDDIPEIPDMVRARLISGYEENGVPWLQDELQRVDPEAFGALDQKNPHRLIRALEVKLHTGKSILTFRRNQKQERSFDTLKLGLELPRETLYLRIDERMDAMVAAGIFEEARSLYPQRYKNALQTVGYQEIFGYMEGLYDLEECMRLLKRNSRRYAKRQLTWFKKDPDFRWFAPDQLSEMLRYIGQPG